MTRILWNTPRYFEGWILKWAVHTLLKFDSKENTNKKGNYFTSKFWKDRASQQKSWKKRGKNEKLYQSCLLTVWNVYYAFKNVFLRHCWFQVLNEFMRFLVFILKKEKISSSFKKLSTPRKQWYTVGIQKQYRTTEQALTVKATVHSNVVAMSRHTWWIRKFSGVKVDTGSILASK